MNHQHVREFLYFSQIMNISKAARDLFISQPALSTHIQKLQTELGFKLVDRSGQGFVLTAAGQRFVERMRPLCDEMDRVLADCATVAEHESHAIALYNQASYYGAWARISKVIASSAGTLFFRVVPHRSQEANLATLEEVFSEGEVNTEIYITDQGPACVRSEMDRRGLRYQRLGRERIVLWANRDNPLLGKPAIEPGDFANVHPVFKVTASEDDWLHMSFLNKMAAQGFNLEPLWLRYDEHASHPFSDLSKNVGVCTETAFLSIIAKTNPSAELLHTEHIDTALDLYVVTRQEGSSVDEFFRLLEEQIAADERGAADR